MEKPTTQSDADFKDKILKIVELEEEEIESSQFDARDPEVYKVLRHVRPC